MADEPRCTITDDIRTPCPRCGYVHGRLVVTERRFCWACRPGVHGPNAYLCAGHRKQNASYRPTAA